MSSIFLKQTRGSEMYFKTTAGKKAIKLMLGSTLLKLGYNRFDGIVILNEKLRPEADRGGRFRSESAKMNLPIVPVIREVDLYWAAIGKTFKSSMN
ncbi:MAG: hypothetical protein U0V64_14745 [Cyclobacteriaceae bacterium]